MKEICITYVVQRFERPIFGRCFRSVDYYPLCSDDIYDLERSIEKEFDVSDVCIMNIIPLKDSSDYEIKPCRICEGKGQSIRFTNVQNGRITYYIECCRCGNKTIAYDTEGEAICDWNTMLRFE